MRPTIKTNLGIKFLAFNLILFSTVNLALAQQRPQQNIRRITVTNQYVLENGNKTSKFWAVYQEMYDSLGRLHTEINSDFPDHFPHNFIWNTFNGKQVVKKEFFENEKLHLVKEYTYNKDSLISKEIISLIKPSDTTVYLTLTYKYNQLNKPIQIEAKTLNAKIAYTSKSTYDLKGTELTRKVKVLNGFVPFDSIITLNCKPSYDSIGRLIGNQLSIVKAGKRLVTSQLSYKYDKKSNIVETATRNEKGKLIHREERVYEAGRNRLQQIKQYDSNNNLIKWLEKRYEIYRTNDLLIREIDY